MNQEPHKEPTQHDTIIVAWDTTGKAVFAQGYYSATQREEMMAMYSEVAATYPKWVMGNIHDYLINCQ